MYPPRLKPFLAGLCRRFDLDTAEACHAYGVKLLPYGVLSGGFLSGKYRGGARPEGARHTKNPDFQSRYATPIMHETVEKYAALADRKGLTMTQLAVAWCGPSVWTLRRRNARAAGASAMHVLTPVIEAHGQPESLTLCRLWLWLGHHCGRISDSEVLSCRICGGDMCALRRAPYILGRWYWLPTHTWCRRSLCASAAELPCMSAERGTLCQSGSINRHCASSCVGAGGVRGPDPNGLHPG